MNEDKLHMPTGKCKNCYWWEYENVYKSDKGKCVYPSVCEKVYRGKK